MTGGCYSDVVQKCIKLEAWSMCEMDVNVIVASDVARQPGRLPKKEHAYYELPTSLRYVVSLYL